MNLALGDVVELISSAMKITAKNGVECDRMQIKDKHGNVGWTTLHGKFLEKFVQREETPSVEERGPKVDYATFGCTCRRRFRLEWIAPVILILEKSGLSRVQQS